MSYEHELDPIQRASTFTFRVRDARDANGALIDFATWTVRFVAKRWLDDSLAPLINVTGAVVLLPATTENPNGWGAADIILPPSATASLLNGLPTNELLLYWEIRAEKAGVSVPLDSGTVPIVRSVEAAA